MFAAGLDLWEVKEHVGSKQRGRVFEGIYKPLTDSFAAMINCRKPIACAVDGHAIAGGNIRGKVAAHAECVTSLL